jgi:hypothetical protein
MSPTQKYYQHNTSLFTKKLEKGYGPQKGYGRSH